MKKIMILVLVLISTMLLFIGCSSNDEPFIQKSYEADGTQIEEVVIDVRDREIEVSLSTDNQIHINYFENSKEYYDIVVSDDKVFTMIAASNKEWTDYIGGTADQDFQKIALQVPDSLLSKLTLVTTNEDIILSALTVNEDISLSTNGGNITFDKVNVGNALNLTAKNGNIHGTIIGSYDDFAIVCKIKKGESNLPADKDKGAKTLNVKNNNGDIQIEFIKENDVA